MEKGEGLRAVCAHPYVENLLVQRRQSHRSGDFYEFVQSFLLLKKEGLINTNYTKMYGVEDGGESAAMFQ